MESNNTGSSYKIIDVIVENTSYFVTKKSEFNKILRKNRGSLEALIIEIEKNNFVISKIGGPGRTRTCDNGVMSTAF